MGRTYPTLETLQQLRPAALTVGALGWYGTSGGALDVMLGDRVVMPPDLAHAVSDTALLLPGSFQVNFLPLLQPDVSVVDLLSSSSSSSPAAAAAESWSARPDDAGVPTRFRSALLSATEPAGRSPAQSARVLVWYVRPYASILCSELPHAAPWPLFW